jgi:ubiquinone/menaquinone biosynthesis C-methylase UbiE
MGVPFDHMATDYDSVFTNSAIGQLQRNHVWKYIETIIPQLDGFDMLELNCGTGEDAMLFSDRGFNIIATDISEEMLKVTQQKVQQYSMQHRISSQYLDLESFNENSFNKKFDLIFSNFGGLNCISPQSLQTLLTKLPLALNKGGRFIAVIMPKRCLWESTYFLAKLSVKKAFRRWTNKEVLTDLQGVQMYTWYYSPRQILRWSRDYFLPVRHKPIGFALPPSYLEPFFAKRSGLLRQLNALEGKFNRISILSGFSDHYLIDLQLR